jgi:DNA-binding MarR family transcriptional regulator
LTSILDRLVARGFVTREPGRTDRRSFDVKLTRAGAAPAAAIRSALSTLETKVVRRTGVTDARTLASVASTLEELVGGRQAERGA